MSGSRYTSGMPSMKLCPAGVDFIKQWEGFVPYAYDDADPKKVKTRIMPGMEVRGYLTIGYGTTRNVKPGDEITEAEATQRLFEHSIADQRTVFSLCKKKPEQHQFDAMVSLCYNIGRGAFARSSVIRHYNLGSLDAAGNSFLAWNKSKGKILKGLVRRREAERKLFLEGVYGA